MKIRISEKQIYPWRAIRSILKYSVLSTLHLTHWISIPVQKIWAKNVVWYSNLNEMKCEFIVITLHSRFLLSLHQNTFTELRIAPPKRFQMWTSCNFGENSETNLRFHRSRSLNPANSDCSGDLHCSVSTFQTEVSARFLCIITRRLNISCNSQKYLLRCCVCIHGFIFAAFGSVLISLNSLTMVACYGLHWKHQNDAKIVHNTYIELLSAFDVMSFLTLLEKANEKTKHE